jgi:hypothetical protein
MKHVTFHLPSFLRRVRIHGGEFDSSARAMNRVSEKGSLMTYERAFLAQAEPRIVRGSTIERKQMSTKTTFKRVALVTVAALGLGAFAVAPSQAVQQMDSLTISSATATQDTRTTTGTGLATATLAFLGSAGVDTMTVTASLVSGPSGNTVLPVLTVTESTTTNSSATVSGLTLTSVPTGANKFASAKFTVAMNTPTVVGDYTIKLTPAVTGGTPNATAVTVKITVSAAAAPVAPTTTGSRVYMRSGALTAAGNGAGDAAYSAANYVSGGYRVVPNDSTTPLTRAAVVTGFAGHIATQDASASNVATLAVDTSGYTLNTIGTEVANFAVIVANGDTITASTITSAVQHVPGGTSAQTVNYAPTTEDYFTAAGFPVTATISGPGYIKYDGVVRGKTFTELSTSGQVNYLQKTFAVVYAGDGNGAATVTFTAGGVTLATRTINWVGAVKSYTTTVSKTAIGIGAEDSATITVGGLDAGSVATAAPTVFAVSSDATVASVSVATGKVFVTGLKAGTSTIKICDTSACTDATITASVSVAISAETAKSITLSLSPAAPQPGEKVTVTLTATDANGRPVADGTRSLLSSTGLTASLNVTGSTMPTNDSVTTVSGVATYSFFAPAGSGALTISGTEGTATDSTTKAAISVSTTITNAAVDAATDAANEAYDAANAATDAALAAAEAADAATVAAQEASDAVAALSESVTKLIAGLQAQIKSLAAVVAKIAKKVKA